MPKKQTSAPCIILDASAIDFLPYGVGRYAREIAARLPALRPAWRWHILRHTSAPAAELARPGIVADAMPKDDYLAEQARWQELCARFSPDLIHSLWFHTAEAADCLRVLTVQDTILLKHYREYQNTHFLGRKPYYYRSIEAADGIIAPSLNTCRELSALMRFPPNAVRHIPLAAAPDFAGATHASRRTVRRKYNLPPKFFFASAHYGHSYKNFDLILAAFNILARYRRDVPPLVVTGKMPPAALHSCMRYLGFVPDRDLAAVIAESLALIYPSCDEGFGLPILEAMACGAPVLCSRSASIPEVAGEAALYFAPANPYELADAMRMMLDYPALRAQISSAGLKRSGQFSWDSAAAETLRFYEDLLAQPRPTRHLSCHVDWLNPPLPDKLPPPSAAPRTHNRFIHHALKLLKSGDTSSAREFLKVELQTFTDSPDALRELGKLHKQTGEWHVAIKYFKRMLKTAENFQTADHKRSALFHLGECMLNLRRKKEAVAFLQRCLEVQPDHVAAKNILRQLNALPRARNKMRRLRLVSASQAGHKT